MVSSTILLIAYLTMIENHKLDEFIRGTQNMEISVDDEL